MKHEHWILLINLWGTLNINEIWPVCIILQKKKNFIKKFYQNCHMKTSSRRLCVWKKLSTTCTGNWNFWSKLYYICNSKTIKICPNQHADLLRFLFTEDSLKIKYGLELVSWSYFSKNFLRKFFFRDFTYTGQISLPDCVYFSSYSVRRISFSCLGIWWRHLIWILKLWTLIFSRTKRDFEMK